MRGIDVPKVSAWMAANIADAVAPFEFEFITGGRSNLTFKVTDATGRRMVLRRPPLGHLLASAHDMAREHRIISAVGSTDVPVAPALGLCTDETVNGAPFYVMAFLDGVVLDGPERGELLPVDLRRTAAFDLVDVLARLHAVDVDAVGLGDLSRREGYIERQVRRWTTQWEHSKTRDVPEIEEVASRLRDHIPVQHGVSIAHGDYRFGNVLTDVGRGRVVGVLDWELCTLGDPLADLGYLGVYWTDPGASRHIPNDPTGEAGYPAYREIVERYASTTGRDVSNLGYYVAFSHFRLAVISEGVYRRYLDGAMGDQVADIDASRRKVEEMAAIALASLKEA